MNNQYNSKEFKRSRRAYIFQATFEYFIALLVSDAFLAKLLAHIGISDALIGVISSFTSLAFIFQLCALFLANVRVSVKKMSIVLNSIGQILFMLTFFVPLLPIGAGYKKMIIVACIFVAYAFQYSIASLLFKWANSYVSPEKRGSFSARKEMFSLVAGTVFTITIGHIIDKFEGLNNMNGGFLFIACSILIVSICNFVCLLLIKKDEPETDNSRGSFREMFSNTLGNKNFRNVIILNVLWSAAHYFTYGFMGIYKTKELMLSVLTVQIINMAANGMRMIFSIPIGKYSDKYSFAKGFSLALYIAAAGFLINVFTTPKTWYLVIAFTALFHIALAGTNSNSFNIAYSYIDADYVAQGIAINKSISGICGFLASLVGAKVLAVVQENGNMLFGMEVYGQQVLSAVSFVIVAITLIFSKRVIERQRVMKQ